jgi:hypothetical protein
LFSFKLLWGIPDIATKMKDDGRAVHQEIAITDAAANRYWIATV